MTIRPRIHTKAMPADRSRVASHLQNLLRATPELGSVHDDGPVQGHIASKFDEALRLFGNRAMLSAGTVSKSDAAPVSFPKDPQHKARALRRADRFVGDDKQGLSQDIFRSLPPDLRKLFVRGVRVR